MNDVKIIKKNNDIRETSLDDIRKIFASLLLNTFMIIKDIYNKAARALTKLAIGSNGDQLFTLRKIVD